MRITLLAYYRFFAHLLALAPPLMRQFIFYNKTVKPIIKKWAKEFPSYAQPKEIKRLLFFGTFIPLMQGKGFALLRGKKMNERERLTMTLFATATPLFDDFFDENFSSPQELELFFELRENYSPKHPKSILLFRLLLEIKPLLSHPEEFVRLAHEVYTAQKTAKEIQENPASDTTSIFIASMDKCEKSCLLFGEILDLISTAQYKIIILQCGLLIQFTDDIFDLWMDHQDGIHTIATRAKSISILQQHYLMEWNKLKQLCDSLPPLNQQRFLTFQWFFFSRTMVALQQLNKLNSHESFVIQNHSRSALVCDMKKINNFHLWVLAFSKQQ